MKVPIFLKLIFDRKKFCRRYFFLFGNFRRLVYKGLINFSASKENMLLLKFSLPHTRSHTLSLSHFHTHTHTLSHTFSLLVYRNHLCQIPFLKFSLVSCETFDVPTLTLSLSLSRSLSCLLPLICSLSLSPIERFIEKYPYS